MGRFISVVPLGIDQYSIGILSVARRSTANSKCRKSAEDERDGGGLVALTLWYGGGLIIVI